MIHNKFWKILAYVSIITAALIFAILGTYYKESYDIYISVAASLLATAFATFIFESTKKYEINDNRNDLLRGIFRELDSLVSIILSKTDKDLKENSTNLYDALEEIISNQKKDEEEVEDLLFLELEPHLLAMKTKALTLDEYGLSFVNLGVLNYKELDYLKTFVSLTKDDDFKDSFAALNIFKSLIHFNKDVERLFNTKVSVYLKRKKRKVKFSILNVKDI